MATTITLKENIKLDRTEFLNIWEFFGYSMMQGMQNKDFDIDFRKLSEREVTKELKNLVAKSKKKSLSSFTEL
jgi:hypothetical protein